MIRKALLRVAGFGQQQTADAFQAMLSRYQLGE